MSEVRRMKAAVLEAPNQVVYKDVEKPGPGHDEALVRVNATSICGSDLLRVFDGAARMYPLILGHEAAGIVTEIGDGVSRELLGTRVALVPLVPCMECAACQRQIYSACERYSFIGSRQSGSYAEYVVAPVQNLVPLPDEVAFEIGAILEPATVALHALERGEIDKGQRVAVLGTGSVGLCAVQWARIQGAELVVATDIVDENRKTARALGAHAVFNPREHDVIAEIRALTGDGVDLALEVAGFPQTLEQAIAITRPRGKVVCVGNQPAGATLPASLVEHIVRQELEVRGAWMSYSDSFPGHEWENTVAAVLRGDLDIHGMISHRFRLSDVEDVFEQLGARTLNHRKIILVP